MRDYARIDDAIGFAYQDEGHIFYVLVFPTADATWVYDVATQAWHQRGWLSSDGSLHRDRANCYASFNGDHLVGDFENGKIYRMSLDIGTDDGAPIYRERAWELADDEHKRVRVDLLEVLAITGDGETQTVTVAGSGGNGFWEAGFWDGGFWDNGFWEGFGTGTSTITLPVEPQLALQVSRDGGRKWSYLRRKGLGMTGRTLARARWRRAGYGRNVVLRISTTMTSRVQWVGANMQGDGYSS